MILIFGGAYQGKKDFALRTFELDENDIEYAGGYDWKPEGKKIIAGFEDFTLALAKENIPVLTKLEELEKDLNDKIIIIADISQGIVPMDKVERLWREENGRAMVWLAGKSDRVYRIFCGMESRIK